MFMAVKFIKWGNGKNVLIFLHYFGGDANCWKWVAEEISSEFTCIGINLPGFGNTQPILIPSILNYALNIQSIIDQIGGIRHYSLIGHSMGGKIALQLAAIDGKKSIKNIILLAPSPPGIEPITPAIKLQLLKQPDKIEAVEIIDSLTFKKLSKFKLDIAVNAQLTTNPTVRTWWVNHGSQQSIIHQLRKIICPVTVLFSKEDEAINYKLIKKSVLPHLKNSKLIEIKKSGHLYPLEIPFCIAVEIAKICK